MAERRRSAILAKKLKRSRLEKSMQANEDNNDFLMRHSTMREDQSKLNESALQTSMNNLSLATLNVPECKPTTGEEEIDKKSFEQWKDLLESSMQLVGVTEEHVKMSIFKIKAGPKLLDVLYGTTTAEGIPDQDSNPYSNAISRLNNYFGSRDYTLMQRQKLRSLTQNSDESDTKYVKRVIAAAKLCDFGGEQLCENVVLTLQSHAVNLKIREICRKVLRKGESLTYLLDKVRAIEIEKVNEELYAKNHQQIKQVAAVSTNPDTRNRLPQSSSQHRGHGTMNGVPSNQQRPFGNGQGFRGRGGYLRTGSTRHTTVSRKPCWRCTSPFHMPADCHVIRRICRRCHERGHIERACTEENATNRAFPGSNEAPPSKIRKIAAVSKRDYDDGDDEAETVSELISE